MRIMDENEDTVKHLNNDGDDDDKKGAMVTTLEL